MDRSLALLDQVQGVVVTQAVSFGTKLLVAAIILAAGFYVGRWAGRLLQRSLVRLHLEPDLELLLVRVLRIVVMGLFAVLALQNLGIELLPLIAGLGVAGAGVALAMQGLLSNLVAGLTIIFTHPFRIGEYIAIIGVEGQVEAISLFNTVLVHADNSRVVVPNRKIVGEILHNYGQIRQLDLSVSIARADELERALAAIHEVVKANPRVLPEPAYIVGVAALSDKSIRIDVKPWVKVPDYLPAGAEINRAIVDRISAAGVDYPGAAREIRVVSAATTH